MDIYGDFYSPEHALSYGRPWIMSIGSRSIGKSTGWMIDTIRRYLKNGRRFIYLRRTDDEVKSTAPSCCDSACIILKNAGFAVDHIEAYRRHFWLYKTENKDGKETPEDIGMYFSLSMSYKLKSANFGAQNYNRIIYDEFINTDPTKYLGTKENFTYEFDRCLELYQTVDRGVGSAFRNETQFVFIANLASYYNPIFLGLGVDEYLRTDSKNISPKGKQWICEQTKEVKATSAYKSSFSYQLADKANQQYAYENIAFDESLEFVKKIDAPMRALFNIAFDGNRFGVYWVESEDVFYISSRLSTMNTLALKPGAQSDTASMLAVRPADCMWLKNLRTMYYQGKVICETKKARYCIANYFMLTP